jgi:hypothetical protein
MDDDKRQGRNTIRTLRARDVPKQIKANWPSTAWIMKE